MLLTGLQNTNKLHVGCHHENQCDKTIQQFLALHGQKSVDIRLILLQSRDRAPTDWRRYLLWRAMGESTIFTFMCLLILLFTFFLVHYMTLVYD